MKTIIIMLTVFPLKDAKDSLIVDIVKFVRKRVVINK